jgi:hypothetical protein
MQEPQKARDFNESTPIACIRSRLSDSHCHTHPRLTFWHGLETQIQPKISKFRPQDTPAGMRCFPRFKAIYQYASTNLPPEADTGDFNMGAPE